MDNLPTTGQELRLLRTAADVRQMDLAAVMGIKPSGVSAIEARRKVTRESAERYVTALATITTSQTASDGASAA